MLLSVLLSHDARRGVPTPVPGVYVGNDIPGFPVTEVCTMPDVASRLKGHVEQLIAAPVPVRVRAWDGSQAGPRTPPPSSYATAGPCATCSGSRANSVSRVPGWPVT
ncbi:hypothetical protein SHKM778_85720 [Streptomyces sp. KM77-8]|uniref:Uncharacterized protein n=1 Tax=Streptomyces haneummycinicus TaxID=3074435 RepID=A0AAT9HXV9_9ACTN